MTVGELWPRASLHPSCSAPSIILSKSTELDASRNPLQGSVLTSVPASPDLSSQPSYCPALTDADIPCLNEEVFHLYLYL